MVEGNGGMRIVQRRLLSALAGNFSCRGIIVAARSFRDRTISREISLLVSAGWIRQSWDENREICYSECDDDKRIQRKKKKKKKIIELRRGFNNPIARVRVKNEFHRCRWVPPAINFVCLSHFPTNFHPYGLYLRSAFYWNSSRDRIPSSLFFLFSVGKIQRNPLEIVNGLPCALLLFYV